MPLNTTQWLDNSAPGAPSITTDPPVPSGHCLRLASQASSFSTKYVRDGADSYIYTDVLTGTYQAGTWSFVQNMSTDQGYGQGLNIFLWVTAGDGTFVAQAANIGITVPSAKTLLTNNFTDVAAIMLSAQRLCIRLNPQNNFYRIWMDNNCKLVSPGVTPSGGAWPLLQMKNSLYNTMNKELR